MSAIVSPPVSFTFRALQEALLTWTLTDQNGVPITGATVTATLYENLNNQNQSQYPGTPVTGFTAIPLIETPALSGIYLAQLPATINPTPSVLGFTTVISALSGSTPVGTWNIPTIITPAQNVIDLTTLQDVKAWLQIPTLNTDDDDAIQNLISGFSQYVLNRTGVASFNSIQTYTEVYDGNNNSRLFLRNYPIISVSNVQIGYYFVPISTGITSPGIFIDQPKRSIAFRSASFGSRWPSGPIGPGPSTGSGYMGSIYPYRFYGGEGSIQVTYQAGYASVPYDLQEACVETVAAFYKRKDWIDLDSKALTASGGGSGTTRYRSWPLTPQVERIINFYSRYGK